MKIDVMGLKFDNMTMDEALSRAEALLRGEKAAYIVTPNAEIAYEALHDVQLREMLNGADLMLPDGAGVVLASIPLVTVFLLLQKKFTAGMMAGSVKG